MHRNRAVKTELRLRIRIVRGDDFAIGPGKADLLEAIERTGSISAAARELGMAYRRAWLLVDSMNRCFRAPLVETATGGSSGGGAVVSELGREVLGQFRAMESKARAAIETEWRIIVKQLRP
jgi:molybdate transport system regulatory protein